LLTPKIPVLGIELSGIVKAVGQKVSNFKPGNEVIADSGTNYGAMVNMSVSQKMIPLYRNTKTFHSKKPQHFLFCGIAEK
jgi:NADPH:quinone reductase-like Zn-dependent oxidoreductase